MTMLTTLCALRERQTWVWLHRWIGLVMTLFLVVAGLTGSLIVFYDELDTLVSPQIHRVEPPHANAAMLDMVTLRERVLAARPDIYADSALAPWRPDRSLMLWVEPRVHGGPPIDSQLFVDPYTGAILGSRRSVDVRQGWINLMPFIYNLHYTLALGVIGGYAFGIVALLWTLDCFIGAYLTCPRGRPFFAKWKPAWGIKKKRFNYDLHRASGSWTWAMLFVLAWSSVALNLGEVYEPVTRALLRINEEDVATERELAGDFVTRWLLDLHMAKVWGLPYRIFVCVMGIVVAALSITGVVIWWRKRRGRVSPRRAR